VLAAVLAAVPTVSTAVLAPRCSSVLPRLTVAANSAKGTPATLRAAPTADWTGVGCRADVPVRATSPRRASSHAIVAVWATSSRSKTGSSWA
jgi:hypothetical protein